MKKETNWFIISEICWCLVLILVIVFVAACDRIPITQDDNWAFLETTKLADVKYTPEGGFFATDTLVLEFENGLILIENDPRYFNKKDFRRGTKYDIYQHRSTKEIKVIKKED